MRLHSGRLTGAGKASYDRLLLEVLGVVAQDLDSEVWTPFALFDSDNRCVAALEVAVLSLTIDSEAREAAGLRSVAVAADARGRGLFRRLMDEAIAWCERRTAHPLFLYTEEPALYERFGFRSLAQHAFVGPAPRPNGTRDVRRTLDLGCTEHRALLLSLIERRSPVSLQAALGMDAMQIAANVAKDDGLCAAYVEGLDALVIFEDGEDAFVLVDILAASIPPLAELLSALGHAPSTVKCLFPPDRLGWRGRPVAEDTGLMGRGDMPTALMRPFMFPPTVEF